jgi:hypothetical protein
MDHALPSSTDYHNAHIELSGVLLDLEDRGREKTVPGLAPPTRLSGKAGAAAQALILHP